MGKARRAHRSGAMLSIDGGHGAMRLCPPYDLSRLYIPAARNARVMHETLSLKPRGRRECRVKASPMARLQQKTQAAVTTGSARSTGIPCAMVYGLWRALPAVPGLIAPVASRGLALRNLTPASGCQDHTISPSASSVARLATQPRPSQPAPTSVAMRVRPSWWDRMAAPYTGFRFWKSEISFWKGEIS